MPIVRPEIDTTNLRDGECSLGAGCFMAIRSPVGYNYEHPIEAQEALEQFAALSVLIRWNRELRSGQ